MMAKVQRFIISGFKGIHNLEIALIGKQNNSVVTLIGLNESGKTTILEAISYFVSEDAAVKSLYDTQRRADAMNSIIPVSKKAAFTGSIEIKADIILDNGDIDKLEAWCLTQDEILDRNSVDREMRVTREFLFEDSVYKRLWNKYSLQFRAKHKGKRSFIDYKKPSDNNDDDLWLKMARQVLQIIPKIAYFPTFLVNLPPRIYLAEHKDESLINKYYRLILQEALSATDENLSLEKHVIERIRLFREKNKTADWFEKFYGSITKSHIDSVFQKLSSSITREVVGNWRKIFQKHTSIRNIQFDWGVETSKSDIPYVAIYISDGESRYAIHERSLGFRWFFSFLLFTSFKMEDSQSTIFLFDEPAANLHAKAQAELLRSFHRITAHHNRIIYSTHSHHMIDTGWLSGAYIVENKAVDYDDDLKFMPESVSTEIVATPYRQFVASNPTRSSYFQPVVEHLQYITPDIVGSGPYLVVEGISDYYVLRYVLKNFRTDLDGITLIPGTGSGSSGPLISYFLGRGDKFAVLLDDDAEGRIQAERYRRLWNLSEETVFTIGHLDNSHSGFALEKLIDDKTENIIAEHLEISHKPKKKEISMYFSEVNKLGPSKAYMSEYCANIIGSIIEKAKNHLK